MEGDGLEDRAVQAYGVVSILVVVSRPGMRLRDCGLPLMYSLDTDLHLASALYSTHLMMLVR